MNKKYPLIITYSVNEDDSEYMTSETKEDETWNVELSSKQEIIEFLKSREMVFINEKIMKALEKSELVFNNEMDYFIDDRESGDWMTTDYVLSIKSSIPND